MLWNPAPEWKGQSAYLIGGGASLKGFDFNLLKGKNTIGVNDAFRLGPDIIKICVFCDAKWFEKTKWDLEKFPNKIVTNSPNLLNYKLPWLLKMGRAREGICTKDVLGFNFSSGATAINLAITLGATQIYLLGYDLSLDAKGHSHWHNQHRKTTSPEAFSRFIKGFESINRNLPKYPDVSVINVTDGSSALPVFAWITFAQFKEVL